MLDNIAIIIFGVGLICCVLAFMLQTARYEIIACIFIIYLYFFKILTVENVFSGFSNNAVITIALIIVLSKCISKSNSLSFVTNLLTKIKSEKLFILVSMLICAFMSAFINNVGALTIMMPIVYKSAKEQNISVSYALMPLAYASVLGGMITSIGTPPNLIVNNFASNLGYNFNLFDYAYLGLPICLVCIFVITYIYSYILPGYRHKKTSEDEKYLVEAKITQKSLYFKEGYESLYSLYNVVGIIRDKRQYRKLASVDVNDIIILHISFIEVQNIINDENLHIISKNKKIDNLIAVEAVVSFDSKIVNKTSSYANLANNFNIFLIGIWHKTVKNLNIKKTTLRPGMQILLLGHKNFINKQIDDLGLVNLNATPIQTSTTFNNIFPILSLVTSLFMSNLGLIELPVALLLSVLSLLIFKIVKISDVYKMIDWGVVTLVAFLLPLGIAIKNINLDIIISDFFTSLNINSFFILILMLIVTMTLSDFINNTATVVIMLPIAKIISETLQTNLEPWLMAVAIGASCAFLTPISHQNNTLVMKPGKYKFFDYVKLGMPVEIIIVITFSTLINFIWPL